MIDEGVALRGAGRDDEALARFRRAYELSPTPEALAQVALAEQALGRWVDAHGHLTEALRAASDPWIASHRRALDQALERIRSRIGRLDLRDGVDGAQVLVNGVEAGTLPLAEPLAVPAGTVVLEVRAEGYVTLRRTLEITPGGAARERVPLVPRTTTGDGAQRAGGGGISPIGPVVLGAGILTLGVGGIFGALALTQESDIADRCGGTACPDTPTLRAANDQMRTYGVVTDVMLVVGGLATITGTILTFTLTEGGSTETTASAGLRPGGAELSVGGSF